jgi:hypothetical protein
MNRRHRYSPEVGPLGCGTSSPRPIGRQTNILPRFFGPEQRDIPWRIANPLLAAAIARGHDLLGSPIRKRLSNRQGSLMRKQLNNKGDSGGLEIEGWLATK